MSNFTEKNGSIEQLQNLVKEIKVVMLTTAAINGELHSRPMAMLDKPFTNNIYFFTKLTSGKSYQILSDSHVNIAFSDQDKNIYVSVAGIAHLIQDRTQFANFWTPGCNTWFPQGIDDPEVALIKVEMTSAEYWDANTSAFVTITDFVKDLLTGHIG